LTQKEVEKEKTNMARIEEEKTVLTPAITAELPTDKHPSVPMHAISQAQYIPPSELIHRLDMILNMLHREEAIPTHRWGRSVQMQAIDALRGALMSVTQAHNEPDVTIRVAALISLSARILKF